MALTFNGYAVFGGVLPAVGVRGPVGVGVVVDVGVLDPVGVGGSVADGVRVKVWVNEGLGVRVAVRVGVRVALGRGVRVGLAAARALGWALTACRKSNRSPAHNPGAPATRPTWEPTGERCSVWRERISERLRWRDRLSTPFSLAATREDTQR